MASAPIAHLYHHLYNTTRWRKRRRQHLDAEPVCVMCDARGVTTAATVADHIIPHRGDLNLFWNGKLQSLCKPHHDSTKQAQERAGYMKGSATDGRPIDPSHPWNRKARP